MDRLIHTALSGMRGSMSRQTVIANNLANANTVGFRGEMTAARSLWIRGAGFGARATTSQEVVAANMASGTINATGRDLDIALTGQAMLAVQAEDGAEAYTRRGDLMVAASGLLTTGDGRPVIGDAGPITVPPADSIRIAEDGALWVVPAGGDPNTPQQIDRLKLANPTGSRVRKALDGLFRVEGAPGGVLPPDPEAQLVPRSLEGSNVEVSQALISMIEASRSWEGQVNLITQARDMDAAAADLMRLPS